MDERNEYPNTDGLILTNSNDAVYLRFADCTPLIFYDTVQKIAAVTHAGWRGTAQKIGVKTIEKMQSNPTNVIALIGPAISMCCYEVSEELKEKFIKEKNNILESELFNGRNLSMEACILSDLKKCNIDDKNITILDECTYCSKGIKLHSYRRTNGDYGRLFSFIFTR